MSKWRYLILAIIAISAVGFIIYKNTRTFSDPFAYCRKVGSIDSVDNRYVGEKMPQIILSGLRQELKAPAEDGMPEDIFRQGSFWRCMNGEVYACNVGANLPCTSKANVDKNPTDAIKEFCIQNPNADIPAVVTGHDTVYEWRCNKSLPEIVKQVFGVDTRGYIANFWYKITPPK